MLYSSGCSLTRPRCLGLSDLFGPDDVLENALNLFRNLTSLEIVFVGDFNTEMEEVELLKLLLEAAEKLQELALMPWYNFDYREDVRRNTFPVVALANAISGIHQQRYWERPSVDC